MDVARPGLGRSIACLLTGTPIRGKQKKGGKGKSSAIGKVSLAASWMIFSLLARPFGLGYRCGLEGVWCLLSRCSSQGSHGVVTMSWFCRCCVIRESGRSRLCGCGFFITGVASTC